MTEQLQMPGFDSYTTGKGNVDTLERYYTPDDVAEFCLQLLPWDDVEAVLEPHAGGGAFLRGLQRRGDVYCVAYDLDPNCWSVRKLFATVVDFLSVTVGNLDRIVGNPPFAEAESHVAHALRLADECAFLLPLDRLESATRRDFWATYPPRHVWVFSERIFAGSRCMAWFWWDLNHEGPTTMSVVSIRDGVEGVEATTRAGPRPTT